MCDAVAEGALGAEAVEAGGGSEREAAMACARASSSASCCA